MEVESRETTSIYLVTVAFTLVDQGVVELDEDLLDVEADQGVVPVLHGDLAGQPQQALQVSRRGRIGTISCVKSPLGSRNL